MKDIPIPGTMHNRYHEHHFMACGFDPQQCDTECRVNHHKCYTCGKSRSQVAEDIIDVACHVASVVNGAIESLKISLDFPVSQLSKSIEAIESCANRLQSLSKEIIVSMAISRCGNV